MASTLINTRRGRSSAGIRSGRFQLDARFLGDGRRRFAEPLSEPLYALADAYLRLPFRQLRKLSRIRHVEPLIGQAPFFKASWGLLALKRRQEIHKLEKARGVGRAASDIERLSGGELDLIESHDKCVDKIFDEQNVPHLHAVAVERNRQAHQGPNQKMRHPTLVFVAELMRSVDTAHTEDHGRQRE